MSYPDSRFDKEALAREYAEICPRFENLAINLHQAISAFLHDADINVLSITYRIKDFESFWEKIDAKQYDDPLEDMEDICGLRILCYYPSDLDKVSQIIEEEFIVLEKSDKADLLEIDKFGYRSLHFIVTLKTDWLRAPNYRGLGGLKAEIQVRTILMHAWAEIEHKLAYKKKEHIPDQFQRKLYQLSALIEVADDQFDSLRIEREEYRNSLVSEERKKVGRFDVNQEMNLDSLQAFLDFYYPDRDIYPSLTKLLDELNYHNITIKDLVEVHEKIKEIILAVETEIMEIYRITDLQYLYNQGGVLMVLLELTNDSYWKSRETKRMGLEKSVLEKWRVKVSKIN